MRMLTLFLFTACLATHAAGVAQNVTLSGKALSLKQVFTAIEKQTGYVLFSKKEMFIGTKPVTLSVRDMPLKEFLELVFDHQPLKYVIRDKTIIVSYKPAVASSDKSDLFADQPVFIAITGIVRDPDGNPLQGASIRIKGSTKGVFSDTNGRFTVDANAGQVLVISFTGYTEREIAITDAVIASGQLLSITLQRSVVALDQVVIQGYGTTTKRLATGNIATISAKEIEQQPVTNPMQALAGRMPGVQVTQSNGLPGAGINVQIRGRNSIAANNDPLYIIDGVPFIAILPVISGTSTATFSNANPLNSIPAENIESISVLKDADATAIYGSRAANGVVLITTKKGTAGKAKLDIDFNRGFSTVTRVATPMSTEQYLQVRRDAFANSGITPTASSAPDLISWDPTVDNNLQDWYLGSTAQLVDASAAFSGGNQQTQFRLSGNYHNEGTVFSNDDKYKRANMLANVSHRSPDGRFSLAFSGLFTTDDNYIRHTNASGLVNIASSVPNYPIYDDQGNYNWLANLSNYHAAANAYWKSNSDNLNGNLVASYDLFEGLGLKASIGYNKIFNSTMRPMPSTSRNPTSSSNLGNNTFASTATTSFLFEPQLTYNRSWNDSRLDALLGATVQDRSSFNDYLYMDNFLNDLMIESKNGGSANWIQGTFSEYKFLSFFTRVNYTWRNRYIVNGTLRRDGSSRFGSGKKFGNFGSIGAAWIFSNEGLFTSNPSMLSYGKLRGSYGSTGSDGIGDYGYLNLYGTTTDYGTLKAIRPSQIANKNFRWEVNNKLEFALDLGFLNDRILFSSAWYCNRSGNQLVTYPLPATTGFSGYTANLPAIVENKGWEFELHTQTIQRGDFRWNTDVNVTVARNKLVHFDNIENTSYANSLVLGKPLNTILTYELIGVDPATGIPAVKDMDGNNVYSNKSFYNNQGGDKTYAGTTDPQWFAGMNNEFQFKGFQLNVFLQYTKQKSYNLFYAQNGFGIFGTLRNGWTAYLDYWRAPNDGSSLPKPFANETAALSRFVESDFTFSDASFLRVKTISLSYNLPNKWLQAIRLSDTKVYLNGQNLWTITNFIGYDPETSRTTSVAIPALRSLTIGFKTSF